MAWDPANGYTGNLLDLLVHLFDHHYPRLDVASRAQDWLINQLEIGEGPFVYRHSADIRAMVSRKGLSKPRYYFSSDFKGIPFDIIASDNEANASFFSSLLGANPVNYQLLTIREALQDPIKVGIVKSDGCESIEQKAFESISTGMNSHPLRPALENLQLDHLVDAGQGLKIEFGPQQLKQRCFRLLSPLNVFPFPSSKKYDHFISDRVEASGIGSSVFGQTVFRYFLFKKFLDAGNSDALDVYYSYLGINRPDHSEVSGFLNQAKNVQINILPVEVSNEKASSKLLKISTGKAKIKSSIKRVLKFNNFGIALCGHDGADSFSIRVITQTGDITVDGAHLGLVGKIDPLGKHMRENTFYNSKWAIEDGSLGGFKLNKNVSKFWEKVHKSKKYKVNSGSVLLLTNEDERLFFGI